MGSKLAKLSMVTKNHYYEASVQTPEIHAQWFVEIYKKFNPGKFPRHLREDFCGSFAISREWVSRNRSNSAMAIDLDSNVLKFGKSQAHEKLNSNQLSRLKILRQNVCLKMSNQSDIIAACNFSFNIFKDRKILKDYFKSVLLSLKKNGVFILDVAGGPGMIVRGKERKTVRDPRYPDNPKKRFTYIWDQKEYDPISNNGKYAIHFESLSGRTYNDVFTYDWRLWSLPELRDVLNEVGFSKALVFWETSTRGSGSGDYQPAKKGDNAYTWIAYLVAKRDR